MLTNSGDWPLDPVFSTVFESLAPDRVLSAMRERVSLTASASDDPWTDCRAIEALYDPGDHVRIAYALLKGDVTAEQRTWPDSDVIYIRYPVRPSMSQRGTIVRLGSVEVELYRFPNDRRLRGLRKFTGRKRAAEAWQRWLNDDEPTLELQPDTLRRSLLRYVPEQKWIARLQARCYDAMAQRTVKRAIAIRSADSAACRNIYARTIAMRRVRNKIENMFRVPRPVALDPELGLLAIRWVWGDSLLDLLRGSDPDKVMRRVAVGLHAFHQAPVEGLPDVTHADQLAQAQQCADDLALAVPSLKTDVDDIVLALVNQCPDKTVETERPCTIHNDFHWNQLRGRADRLTLLDFERCAIGDPLTDVANFTTQMSMLGVRGDVNVSVGEASLWAESFLKGWRSTTGIDLDDARMRWHSAITLLVLARGMMRHLRQGWPEIVEHCIRRAAEATAPRDGLEVSA